MSRGRVYKPTYTYQGEKRESNVWWVDYSVDGKRRRESAETESEEEAERYLTRKLREHDVYGPREADYADVQFGELAELIRTDYERNGYRSDIEKRLSPLEDFFGGVRVVQIGGAQVDSYVTKRLGEGKAPATVNRELSCLRRMLTLGQQYGIVLADRAPDVAQHMMKENNVRKGFFTRQQFEAVRDALPARLRAFVTFAYTTGWRKSELLSRDWRHVDTENGWIRLDPGETKNGKGRQYPLTPELREAVEEQRQRKAETEEEYGVEVEALFFYFEPSRNGRAAAGRRIGDFRKAWKTAVKKAGCPDRIVHDFRRTAARNHIRAGVPESVIMELCGWETRSVFERYSVMNESDLREQAAKLAAHQANGKDAARNGGKVEDNEATEKQEA